MHIRFGHELVYSTPVPTHMILMLHTHLGRGQQYVVADNLQVSRTVAEGLEVYLGGQWHIFDPRNNARRIGRILIARGRDAGDVAISTAFGPAGLQLFQVWTDQAENRPLQRAG
jgi:transglutaminase-like putative cysteine protease